MSKIVYICERSPKPNNSYAAKLRIISTKIVPDNITPNDPVIVSDHGITYALINPVSTIVTYNSSVLMGVASSDISNWWKPGAAAPDGSYSLYRADEAVVELVTDVVASRTIWYYQDDAVFIASSSQRAIIILLQNLSFNEDVLPWILSTGSLGPGNSWDQRLKMVQPDSIVTLDRVSWKINVQTNPVIFSSVGIGDSEHKNNLRNGLENTFRSLKLDFTKWILPLSGGFDSRSILCFFVSIGENLEKLKTITWGLKRSQDLPDNDAFVAKQVASYFNLPNTYYETDATGEPLSKIFNRFLICGEGRIDHFGGYTDGFKVWKTLFECNVEGIIRGDESLGWVSVESELQVRYSVGVPLCSDFINLESYKDYGIPTQNLSEYLVRRNDESLEKWRDRLYQQYRIPVILSALNDLKLSYVEIINPLLSRMILCNARSLPDHLRENKKLFKAIVNEISPDISFAKTSATAQQLNVFKSPEAIHLFKEVLLSEEAKKVFSQEFLMHIISKLDSKIKEPVGKTKKSIAVLMKKHLPQFIKTRLWALKNKSKVDYNLIGFRAYIAIKMHGILCDDAALLQD